MEKHFLLQERQAESPQAGASTVALPSSNDVSRPQSDSPPSDFAAARLVVTIYSRLLGEKIYLVSDNVPEPTRPSPHAIYRASEMVILVGLPPEALQTLHHWKKVFGGTIASIQQCEGILPENPHP